MGNIEVSDSERVKATILIPRWYLLHVAGLLDMPLTRPDAEVVYIIHWEALGIIIPWPVGMSRDDAITAWAVERSRSGP